LADPRKPLRAGPSTWAGTAAPPASGALYGGPKKENIVHLKQAARTVMRGVGRDPAGTTPAAVSSLLIGGAVDG